MVFLVSDVVFRALSRGGGGSGASGAPMRGGCRLSSLISGYLVVIPFEGNGDAVANAPDRPFRPPPLGCSDMDSRRRHVIAAAVLVPAGPLVLLNVAEWGAAGLTAGAVGGLVAMPATAGLVYAVLRGLDRRTGTAAVFVLAWGAVVLASAVGESAAALAANELAARAETAQPWGGLRGGLGGRAARRAAALGPRGADLCARRRTPPGAHRRADRCAHRRHRRPGGGRGLRRTGSRGIGPALRHRRPHTHAGLGARAVGDRGLPAHPPPRAGRHRGVRGRLAP